MISICDLNTGDNQSRIGNTYIDSSGTEQVITESGVASHPNDSGMAAIAERLIEQLGI